MFIEDALGLGSAKPRPIGVGLADRLRFLGTLPESPQIDDFPHARLPQQKSRASSQEGLSGRIGPWPAPSSFKIPVDRASITSKINTLRDSAMIWCIMSYGADDRRPFSVFRRYDP
jgi:hypothetical protein